MADERTALEAVVAADVELMQLREEEAELTARMNDASLDEGAAEPSSQDRADDEADRLTAIYDRMQVCLPAISCVCIWVMPRPECHASQGNGL